MIILECDYECNYWEIFFCLRYYNILNIEGERKWCYSKSWRGGEGRDDFFLGLDSRKKLGIWDS